MSVCLSVCHFSDPRLPGRFVLKLKVSAIPTMVQRVMLLEHSFVHRLAKFMADTDRENFEFELHV